MATEPPKLPGKWYREFRLTKTAKISSRVPSGLSNNFVDRSVNFVGEIIGAGNTHHSDTVAAFNVSNRSINRPLFSDEFIPRGASPTTRLADFFVGCIP
jgi:hypothetical protein